MNAMPPTPINAVASLRARLWKAGYRPVALKTGDKMPMVNGWPDRARRDPPADAADAPSLRTLNTGLLADGLRILDLDVDDANIVSQLSDLAATLLGNTPCIRRRSNAPRAALLYRAAEGQPPKRIESGTLGKVEVLGHGNQLHAYGKHPSGADLTWSTPPDEKPVHQLPAVTEDQIASYLAAVAPLIGAKIAQQSEAPKDVPAGERPPADQLDVIAALLTIPSEGADNFESWNRVGMATWAATGGSAAGFAAWCAWSSRSPAHDEKACQDKWRVYQTSPPTTIGAGTLFHLARQARPGWSRPSESQSGESWPLVKPEMASKDPLPPPELPLRDIFSPGWERWVEDAAESKGAPTGFVALALLSTAGALIGNARWAQPWEGWEEPPVIYAALIGNPSSGKSPALDALTAPLSKIEEASNEDLKERKRRYATDLAAAEENRDRWQKDVKTAVAMGTPPPMMPGSADTPDPVARRRIYSTDPTVAKAERLSAGNPKGLLLLRDELAGWIAGMDRFTNGGGADRAFWLQAYGGRNWTPDRVKDGDAEISVPHLLWSIVGGIQPDRLASMLLAGEDDGLSARFLYTWPPKLAPKRPRDGLNVARVSEWLSRLHTLPWQPPAPVLLPFTPRARDALDSWKKEVADMEEGASGMFLSWIGKLPGFSVRLSLIFTHLAWCETGREALPSEINEISFLRAVTFLSEYAVPMAKRCFGEAALPEPERDARRLARWVLRRNPVPTVINVRELRRMQDGPGIPTPDRLKASLDELEGLGWVRQANPNRTGVGGRSRNDWIVNPSLIGGNNDLA